MRTCEPGITVNKGKEGIEVPYIVHTALFFVLMETKWRLSFTVFAALSAATIVIK